MTWTCKRPSPSPDLLPSAGSATVNKAGLPVSGQVRFFIFRKAPKRETTAPGLCEEWEKRLELAARCPTVKATYRRTRAPVWPFRKAFAFP